MRLFRLLVQLICFIFLPGLVGLAFLEIKTLFIDLFNANFIGIFTDCSLFLILALGTMIIGRFFCGWMCMFGSYNDWVHLFGQKVFKINYKINQKIDSYLKYIKFVVLIFITCFLWTGIMTLPGGMSPWDALMQLGNISYVWSNYLGGLIILIGITIGALFIDRFFCRYLCPLGAIWTILSKLRIVKIDKKRDICGPCRACSLKCAMGIDLNAVDEVNSGECINCFNCVTICPKDNAKCAINHKRVNEYLAATLAVAGTSGLYVVSDKILQNYNTSVSEAAANSIYADGTYTGIGNGYRPNTKVNVTISNGKISVISLVSTNDTDSFFNKAWSTIKNAILKAQATDVNTVSGATRSSNGIIAAVNDALSQAEEAKKASTSSTTATIESDDGTTSSQTESSTTNNITSSSSNGSTISSDSITSTDSSSTTTSNKIYNDGTYTGTGVGYKPYTKVSVTIKNDKITSITLISTNDTDNFFNRAWTTIKNAIISAQSIKVNTVSGATRSSNGIIAAVNDALTQAKI